MKEFKSNRFKKGLVIQLFFVLAILIISSCANPVNSVDSELVDSSLYDLKKYPQTTTLGIVWDKFPLGDHDLTRSQPIFPSRTLSDDDPNVCDPNVIKDENGLYHMWYTLITDETIDDAVFKRHTIAYTTSPDGINWAAGTPLDSLNPETDPTVYDDITYEKMYDKSIMGGVRVSSIIRVKTYDGFLYKLWYRGKNSIHDSNNWKLYYAESKDGINWTKEYFDDLYLAIGKASNSAGQFFEKSVGNSTVLRDTANYKMWFDGTDSVPETKIGYATSSSGSDDEDWKIVSEVLLPGFSYPECVTEGFSGVKSFDATLVESPFVIKDGDAYIMWYTGKYHNRQVGLAYSLDGKNFIYYNNTHTPVLEPFMGNARWERLGYRDMCVIKDVSPEGVKMYKMWFTAESNKRKFRIGYAESIQLD